MIPVRLRTRSWGELGHKSTNFGQSLRHDNPHLILDWPHSFDTKEEFRDVVHTGFHYLCFQLLTIQALLNNGHSIQFSSWERCIDDARHWQDRGPQLATFPPHTEINILHEILRRLYYVPNYQADLLPNNQGLNVVLHHCDTSDERKFIKNFSSSVSLLMFYTNPHTMAGDPVSAMPLFEDPVIENGMVLLRCEKVGFSSEVDAILWQGGVIVEEHENPTRR